MEAHAVAPVVNSAAVDGWRYTMLQEHSSKGISERQIAKLEKWLRWTAERLDVAYSSPHLGNLADPTAEYVFIVLSRKTAERAYMAAFQALRQLGPWEQVLRAGQKGVEQLIRGCGLEKRKAHAIVAGLQAAKTRFGTVDLSHAGELSDEELFEFLYSLPEVGPKSARCVMLYSFGRPVFPVDAHVGRVLARLGFMKAVGLDLSTMGHKQRQAALEHTVPPDLRFCLHVNLVTHGRAVCSARRPSCPACMLSPRCEAFKASAASERKQFG